MALCPSCFDVFLFYHPLYCTSTTTDISCYDIGKKGEASDNTRLVRIFFSQNIRHDTYVHKIPGTLRYLCRCLDNNHILYFVLDCYPPLFSFLHADKGFFFRNFAFCALWNSCFFRKRKPNFRGAKRYLFVFR